LVSGNVIRAYDSNFCFDIWRVTNADYLLTYLRNSDVIMCHGYKLDSLNWCCQLLLCFDGELNLVR